MAYRTVIPDRGDIVHLNFAPSAGREMTGPHYALVLSTREYARVTGMILACPITSHVRGWEFEVSVPAKLLPPKQGVGEVQSVVLASAVRQLDFRERGASVIAHAPLETVQEVQELLGVILGILT